MYYDVTTAGLASRRVARANADAEIRAKVSCATLKKRTPGFSINQIAYTSERSGPTNECRFERCARRGISRVALTKQDLHNPHTEE